MRRLVCSCNNLGGDQRLKHLVKMFGLSDERLRHIILFVFQYIEVRRSEGERDLNVIKQEIFTGSTPRLKAALGRDA